MCNKWMKRIGIFLLETVCITIISMGISIALNGMHLLGVPNVSHIQKVIIDLNKTDEVKKITDTKQIDLAVNLTGFLSYSPFISPDLSEKPAITITYYLDNGQNISVSANDNTVWWKNKAHAIKQEGDFVKLTEGIFHFNETD